MRGVGYIGHGGRIVDPTGPQSQPSEKGAKLVHFWIIVWTVTLIGGIAIFAGLFVVVAIRGIGDIRSLFESIADQHKTPPSPP